MKWFKRFALYGWAIVIAAAGVAYYLMRGGHGDEGRVARAHREVRAVHAETAAKVTKSELGTEQALADIHAKHEATVKAMRASDEKLMDELERDPVRLARFVSNRSALDR